MKKWVKVTIISLLSAGIVATSGHFIGVEVSKNLKLNRATETFIEKLEKNRDYQIKHLNIDFFDQQTSHHFSFSLNDMNLKIGQNDTYNFRAEMDIFYDYIQIYSGSAVFLDNMFYLDTKDSMFTSEDISFNYDTIKNFRESYNNSTLVEVGIFDFNLDFSLFDDMKEKVKEVKTKDLSTFVFEYPIKKRNSTIMFYSDADYNVRKLKTLTALEYENTLISFDASNISFLDNIEINKPQNEYKEINPLLNGIGSILDKFNKETGKGLSVDLGNHEGKPFTIYTGETKLVELTGQLNIYNKTEKDDFLLNYIGKINATFGGQTIENEVATINILNDVVYIDIGSLISGSIKVETLEKLLEINKEQLISEIKTMSFNIVDLIGVNSSFNDEYKLIKSLSTSDESITATLSLPVQKQEEINKEVSVSFSYDEKGFNEILLSDITYKSLTLSNISMAINEELPEKPTINPDDYSSLDEIIENIINFNWKN